MPSRVSRVDGEGKLEGRRGGFAAAGTRTGTGAPALVPEDLGGAALCCFFGRGTGRERFTDSGPWRSVLSSAALYTRRPPRPPQEPPPVSTGRNPPTQANGCLQGHGSGKLELVERVGEEMEGMRLPPLCDRAASTPPRLMLWRRGLVREKATRGHARVPPCGH